MVMGQISNFFDSIGFPIKQAAKIYFASGSFHYYLVYSNDWYVI